MRGGGRTAELHKVMNIHRELVKETHFACVSEEVGCALGKQIFG